MRVALVFPRSTFLIDPLVYPPLGLWYLAAQLEALGHEVDFFDMTTDKLPADGEFDQIWVSATSAQMAEVRKLGSVLLPYTKTRTVLGGPAIWAQGARAKSVEGFDVMVAGESDHPEIINSILNSETGVVIVPRPLKDLDHIIAPLRRWDSKYHSTLDGKSCTTMFTIRGCPYGCAFCESSRNGTIWDKKVRFEPLPVVLQQIEEIGMTHEAIQFFDDILPLDTERMYAITRKLKAEQMTWRCFIRTDLTITRGRVLLENMKQSGLVEVLAGIESASNRIKNNIHKGTTIEQDTLVMGWCKQLGIRFKASLILGLPGETRETMQDSLDWILKNRPDRVDLNILIPFPGTPITIHPEDYDVYCNEEVPEEYWYKGQQAELKSLVGTSSLTPTEIEDFHRDAIRQIAEAGIPY